MHLSLSTEYAIHSLFFLALQGKGKLILVSDVARAQNISESYLAKVFQTLSKAGLIKSFRGAKGGYILAQEPEKISLRRIVEVMEGKSPIFVCDDHKRSCDFLGNCVIQHVMLDAETKMFEVLEKTSLADLLVEFNPDPVHLDKENKCFSVPFWGNSKNRNEKKDER